jgi:hypothetical protein
MNFPKIICPNPCMLADANHVPGSQDRGFGTEGRGEVAQTTDCYSYSWDLAAIIISPDESKPGIKTPFRGPMVLNSSNIIQKHAQQLYT